MAKQLQQERRGGVHARPGPPARPQAQAPDARPAPSHRAPASGRHNGTRVRPSDRSRLPRNAALGVVALVLAGATAFWLQDLRGPASTGIDALRAPDAGTAPSAAPSPSALSTSEPSAGPSEAGAGPTSEAGVDPPAGSGVDVGTALPPASDRAPLLAEATGANRGSAALQAALEQVLMARATATTSLLRAVVTGELETAAAAAAAVDATSNELETVLTTWTDAERAAQLREAFDLQVVAGRAYATAVRDDDDAAADQARAELGATSRVLGTSLEELTSGAVTRFVPPEDAARMRDFVDAHAAGDAATAADLEAWLTARTGREGVAIATALAGPT